MRSAMNKRNVCFALMLVAAGVWGQIIYAALGSGGSADSTGVTLTGEPDPVCIGQEVTFVGTCKCDDSHRVKIYVTLNGEFKVLALDQVSVTPEEGGILKAEGECLGCGATATPVSVDVVEVKSITVDSTSSDDTDKLFLANDKWTEPVPPGPPPVKTVPVSATLLQDLLINDGDHYMEWSPGGTEPPCINPPEPPRAKESTLHYQSHGYFDVQFGCTTHTDNSKEMRVYVEGVNLTAQGVGEEKEDENQLCVFLNEDFDHLTPPNNDDGTLRPEQERDFDDDELCEGDMSEVGVIDFAAKIAFEDEEIDDEATVKFEGSGFKLYIARDDSAVRLTLGEEYNVKDDIGVTATLYVEGTSEGDTTLTSTLTSKDGYSCKDVIQLKIVKLDVQALELGPKNGDKDEIFAPEVIVRYNENYDGDSTKQKRDYAHSGFAVEDDDLVKYKLQKPNADPNQVVGESVNIAISSGIKLWEDRKKSTAAKTSYKISELPKDLYVEGVAVSSAVLDQSIKVTLQFKSEYGGRTCEDTIRLTVVQLAIDIHKAKVVDSGESIIPDNEKLDKGSITFENLDNDDEDGDYDYDVAASKDDDEVAGGDDELVKSKVRVAPVALKDESVDVSVLFAPTAGAGTVQMWKVDTKHKDKKHAAADKLDVKDDSEFTTESTQRIKDMWIEGISPHTAQRAAKFRPSLEVNGNKVNGDEVSLTVLGVKSVAWKAKNNGYTADGKCNANTLDQNNNMYRVFPCAATPGDSSKDKVDCEIELTVAPPYDVKVFTRAFDVDDPSSDAKIDMNDAGGRGRYCRGGPRYTAQEDNRGDVGGKKAGEIDGQDGAGIKEIAFATGDTKKTVEFQVSMFAGDNYTIAANGDKNFVGLLRNFDKDDGMKIVNADEPGAKGTQKEIQRPGAYASDRPLVVWRVLHIEADSMKAPQGVENKVKGGNIQGVWPLAGNPNVYELNLDVDLDDGSVMLPAGKGRFENGEINVAQSPAGSRLYDVIANRQWALQIKASGYSIPFYAEDNDRWGNDSFVGNTDNFYVHNNGNTSYFFPKNTVPATGIDWNDYKRGRLVVGGNSYKIKDVKIVKGQRRYFVTQGRVLLPFQVLRDDDVDTSLPHTLSAIGTLTNSLAEVYYLPVVDGGGNMNNNKVEVPFRSHYKYKDGRRTRWLSDDIDDGGHRQSETNETDNYWVAYMCCAWQYLPQEDNDPDTEFGTGGVAPAATDRTHTRVAKGGQMSFVFMESIRDRLVNNAVDHDPGLEGRVATHELGHQLGLAHLFRPTNIMGVIKKVPANDFLPRHQNLLRCRVKSPGQ